MLRKNTASRKKGKSFKVKCSSTCIILGTLSTTGTLALSLGGTLLAARLASQKFNSTATGLLQHVRELSFKIPSLNFTLENMDFPIPQTTISIPITPQQIQPLIEEFFNALQTTLSQNTSGNVGFNTSVSVPSLTVPVVIPQEQIYALLDQFASNAFGTQLPSDIFTNVNQTLSTNVTIPGMIIDAPVQLPSGLLEAFMHQLFANTSQIVDGFNQSLSINYTTPQGLSVPINGLNIPIDFNDTFNVGSFIGNETLDNIQNGIGTASNVIYFAIIIFGAILSFFITKAVLDEFLIFGRKAQRDDNVEMGNINEQDKNTFIP